MPACNVTANTALREGCLEMAMAHAIMPLGIIVRRQPGVTRWAKWSWKVISVLPGAGPADWSVLRQEGDVTDFHAATLPLELWESDTDAYMNALSSRVPGVVVVLTEEDVEGDIPWRPLLVTASPYEGQDYMDSGEGLIEQVPMSDGLIAWVRDFCDAYHQDEEFVKRKRDRKRVDLVEDGKGDPRVRQMADVYRAPRKREVTS